MCVKYSVVGPFILYLLAIVFSVLRFTDSDYPFGILKLFLSLYFVIYFVKKHRMMGLLVLDIQKAKNRT